MILLTGATGNTGSLAAAHLTRLGVPFWVMSRSPASEAKLSALGYQTAQGDLDQPERLQEILSRGVEKVYLVCTPDEKMIERECNLIEAARHTGVKQVVKMSAFGAAADAPTAILRAHAEIERRLISSGIPWTIIRPHGFMQTFVLLSLRFIREAGLYLHPAGDGAMPLIDVRDLAEVVVRALTEEGHLRKSYDVTGPAALTFREQARILAEALGRPVTYMEAKERHLKTALQMMEIAPMAAEHVAAIMKMCREHKFDFATQTLARLGVTPTPFARFVEDLVAGRPCGEEAFHYPSSRSFRALSRVLIWVYRSRFSLFGRG